MFNWFRREPERPNYGKIIAISVAAVAVASAIAFVIYKLIKKYTEELVCDCDDLLDDECCCDECSEETNVELNNEEE
mgnify:CR=1 FL=1